jgi:hypothetical protein
VSRLVIRTTVLAALLGLGACTRPAAPPAPHYSAQAAALTQHVSEVDARKDEVLRQLAICESGGSGDSDKPIYGGRGTYAGRFQFTTRTVINYVKEMDGRTLSSQEALALAHDYHQAAELAKYVIFDRGHYWNWPACSRKLGIPNQVAQINAM